MLFPVNPERVIRFPVSTILAVLAIVIGVWALLQVVLITRQVLTWGSRRPLSRDCPQPRRRLAPAQGHQRRGYAVALTALGVAGLIALVGWLVIPQLVDQVNQFANKVPDYIDDLTKGRGRFGFLETKYNIVERVACRSTAAERARSSDYRVPPSRLRKAFSRWSPRRSRSLPMTYFMLLRGPMWMERFYSLFSLARSRAS